MFNGDTTEDLSTISSLGVIHFQHFFNISLSHIPLSSFTFIMDHERGGLRNSTSNVVSA